MPKANLLLLHGALGTKIQLESLKVKLSGHFHVFSLNFEGHGDRISDKDFSIDLFSENVIGFLKEKGISNTHIFGYSMGGYVALNLALNNPELINRIVTLGTKFNWSPEIAAQEIKMLNPEKIEEKVPAFAKRLEELHAENDWKKMMNKTAKMMIGLGDGQGLTDDGMKSIGHAVLIGIGELDKMVTVEESENAAGLLQNGEMKIIEGFKHPIEQINMSELASALLVFIKRN